MKKKLVFRCVWLFYLLPAFLSGQVLPDQIWLLGTNDLPGQPGYGNTVLQFLPEQTLTTPASLHMNFESTMAVMPDTLGNILFYTNGCHIANSLGDTMSNGSGLNPGEMADWTCPSSGYTAPLGAMALHLPGSQHLYYLFHMGVKYSPERKLSFGPFYYTIIDMSLDGGKGSVVSKNNVLAAGNLEPFVAVRHGNGRDWWLVVPEYGSNKYHKFLFSAQGIQTEEIQETGDVMTCHYIGSAAFSADGRRYARAQNCGVVIMDFDRCSGQFSNPKYLNLPSSVFGGGGVAFSREGNKLLITTQLSIQEADLTLANPVLDTIVPTLDLVGASLHLMQYAPDDKIYLSNLGRGQYYHVVNTPNENDLGFAYRALPLSTFTMRTLPNYPNYRLYDLPGSVCDSLGINAPVVATASPEAPDFRFWPNPAQQQLEVRTNLALENVAIFDALGRQILTIKPTIIPKGYLLDVQALPPGVYFLSWQASGRTWSGKFLKI